MIKKVRTIVQRWLDTSERIYPCHLALRDLAVLLHLERGREYVPPTRRKALPKPDPRQLEMWGPR
jgi:hypothetical protein